MVDTGGVLKKKQNPKPQKQCIRVRLEEGGVKAGSRIKVVCVEMR